MTSINDCANCLHEHPLPKLYIAAHTEAGRRLRAGWRNKKCPECGLHGWEKP